jgi:NTE family protein
MLENFRAFNYVAGGLRNVFSIRNRLEFRLEGYLFKPIEYLTLGNNQEAKTINDFKKVFFAGNAGLVLHSPMGPISLSVNYYDDAENQLGVLLHVGYLLFNKHSVE